MRCADVRGFNYDGSWGTSGLDLWQHFDLGMMAVEVERGKRYFPGWNVCRWWLSQEAFQRSPERFLANFEMGLGILEKWGIAVIPVLFNRWRDAYCDFGGVFLEQIIPGMSFASGAADDLFGYTAAPWPREAMPVEATHRAYLEAVTGTHRDDRRIYAWDLCNEPFMGPYVDDPASALRAGELRWLTWGYGICKGLGVSQPLTIGAHRDATILALVEPISDILSCHPYYIWNAPGADEGRFEKMLDGLVAVAKRSGKELLVTETAWGAEDDSKRVEVLRYTLGEIRKRGLGFLVHALQHSLIADLHYRQYGPVGSPGAMHFVNPDGSLRAGHEAFNEF